MISNDPPFNRRQSDNRQPAPGPVLLIEKGLVTGNKNVDPTVFGCLQELPVLQPIPTLIAGRKNLMLAKMVAQAVVKVLVKLYLHG